MLPPLKLRILNALNELIAFSPLLNWMMSSDRSRWRKDSQALSVPLQNDNTVDGDTDLNSTGDGKSEMYVWLVL